MKKSTNTDGYLHVLKYISLFGGVQGLNVLIGVIRNKIVALLLGPQGVGLISLFNSSIRLVSDSTNFGIAISAVRNLSSDYDNGEDERLQADIRIVRSWSLLTAVLGMVVCIALSPLLSHYSFSWNGYTFDFILLSPIIALTAITNGEMAILKAVRRLRQLAELSVYNVLGTSLLTIPLYYFFGERAIVPSLLLAALVQVVLTLSASWRLYPFKLSFSRSDLGAGLGMIRLGVAFVLAGVLGSGADFIIRSYLNNVANTATVGFYNAAYMMTMVYAGMIFSAMETDYFPRLSGVNQLSFTFRQTVNRQIEVTLLLVSPLLALFLLLLPQLLEVLYSGRFLPALGMAQVLVLAMYVRAVRLPMEYISLAKGASRAYLILESTYDLLLVALLLTCFNKWGITGAGIGIALAGMLHLLIVYVYMARKYRYRMSADVLKLAALQFTLGILTFFCVRSELWQWRWCVASGLCLVSAIASVRVLRSKTDQQWNSLRNKIKDKFIRHDKG